MKCRDLGEFDNVNAQIQEILMQSSKEIIGKLIHYYDQAVVSEHDFLRSLNDELATYKLPPNERSELEDFDANISLKKEIIRTKLEKRRVTKIQKLLRPEAEVSKNREDTRPPNPKNKYKDMKKKKSQNKKSRVREKDRDQSLNKRINNRDQPRRTQRFGPPLEKNKPDGPDRQRWNRDNRGYRPGRDRHYRGNFGSGWQQSGYRDNRDSRYQGQNRSRPGYRSRYFHDSAPRWNQGYVRNNRNNDLEGFLSLREGEPSASLTASDLLKVLLRAGVFRT